VFSYLLKPRQPALFLFVEAFFLLSIGDVSGTVTSGVLDYGLAVAVDVGLMNAADRSRLARASV